MKHTYTKRYAIIDPVRSTLTPQLNLDIEWLVSNFARSASWYGEQNISSKWAYRDLDTFDYIDRTFYFAHSEDYLLFVVTRC